MLLGGDTALLGTMFSTKTALVFLVFTLLYTPCVAAIASVRREMGTKKAAFMVAAIQCLIAWIFSAFSVKVNINNFTA